MKNRSCFIVGNHNAGAWIIPILKAEIEKHITEYGVTDFYVGKHGSFDGYAADIVNEEKRRYPQIRLFLLLPYYIPQKDLVLEANYDDTFYPPDMEYVPRRYAIVRANRYMIDNTDYLIAFSRNPAGNTRKLIDYAENRAAKGLVTVSRI